MLALVSMLCKSTGVLPSKSGSSTISTVYVQLLLSLGTLKNPYTTA
ncbi:hypothetical protein PF005_g17932 [Phytophthora fragariae]|uniref:Uncharacterized protein n=2 Tax=Phytophthora TaxID=4783 RepID=A0A6A3F691_9STRA|nr:hypothetical protein PF003_g2010 [Phytophthora fragariae]KAE8978903.1 hypothetical protein PR001_g24710 [Phytophthora rubi]KAE8939240.1 hypothetical protein PF009_g10912 [Phytophthora fragariae]KAE8991317.1 hypothetical protein PF011_g17992 [Phytophthora fragariae]KAE8999101.1 hypothetical protein PR002_g18559 [Phytophthora rubi]